MRFQVYFANEKLAASLEKLGYKVFFLGVRERIGSGGSFKVREYEIQLQK
jgi:hypothetical protein